MLKRELYLNRIRGFYDSCDLVKILYGIRRCGKSVILEQIKNEISKNNDKSHIIYINFEFLEFEELTDYKKLHEHILSQVTDDKIYYVFLDEIGLVKKFEKVVNSLRAHGNISIFITGSNSKLTFAELSTELSGRYVSFKINPLSFKEIVKYTNTTKDNYLELLYDIFKWGSLPRRFLIENDRDKFTYITDVYNSIVLKDVVERLGIKDITTFNKIFQYLLETEGREFSQNNVINYLKNENVIISTETLYRYLEALCSVFLINRVQRFDIRGKNVLKTLNKYYVTDIGIKNVRSRGSSNEEYIALENIVYNELILKDYEVYVGKNKKYEVDFVAYKDGEYKYIQVSLYVDNEETRNREFNALKEIDDNFSKYLITLDKTNYSKDGINHINIFDFLMNDDF